MHQKHRPRPADAVPLNAVRAFDVAATSGSFSAAARRLDVGQSTISRHIATLEHWLNLQLFIRTSSTSELTAEGQQLHEATSRCFSNLDDALRVLQRASETANQLTVDVSVAFATLWLLPRLDDFLASHPDVDVRVVTHHEGALPSADADIVVEFGEADLTAEGVVEVVQERLVVIRSPRYEMATDRITKDGLQREQLLGLDSAVHHNDWATLLGRAPAAMHRSYSSYTVYLQAVLEGQGLGIGSRPLLDRHLHDGRLVTIGAWDTATDRSYFATRHRTSAERDGCSPFMEWIANTGSRTNFSRRSIHMS